MGLTEREHAAVERLTNGIFELVYLAHAECLEWPDIAAVLYTLGILIRGAGPPEDIRTMLEKIAAGVKTGEG